MAQPRWPGKRASHIVDGNEMHPAGESADDLGQVRQNQQQRGGEKNEPGLTNFRLFEHGLTAFLLFPDACLHIHDGKRCTSC